MKTEETLTRHIARAGMIGAMYAALTLLTMTLLQGLAFGPVQFRISEAVVVTALLTRSAVSGLFIGCMIANLIGIALNGSGALGMLDVVFGSAATLIGAAWAWRMRSRPKIALLGTVVSNAVIVSAYLPVILAAYGFYTVPFTDIDLSSSYPAMLLFGFVTIGLGEAAVVYLLGLPLYKALRSIPALRQRVWE
jgi:uncharacterized membrane protein